MLPKRNLIAIAAGTVFLLISGVASVSAADTAKESGHQHQGGQHEGHGDTKSGNHHEHQCKHKMSPVDADKDGKINKEEFMKHHEVMFDKKDTNKDGFLDETEMHQMTKHMHEHKHDQKKEGGHAHGDAKNKDGLKN